MDGKIAKSLDSFRDLISKGHSYSYILIEYCLIQNIGIELLRKILSNHEKGKSIIVLECMSSIPYILIGLENGFRYFVAGLPLEITHNISLLLKNYDAVLFVNKTELANFKNFT